MKDILSTVLAEWIEKKLPDLIDRDIDLSNYLSYPKKIIVISGFRRVGKTYLTYQLIKKLLKNKNKEEVIYLNFEDERIPTKTEVLSELIPTLKENFSHKPYVFFLDEIHVIPNWSKWLRRVHDNHDFFLFVTGSSSKMSIKEIPTELRGRYICIEVFPLTFEEFLNFKKIVLNKKKSKKTEEEKAIILKALNEYVIFGGLPAVVLESESRKKELLQNYYWSVVHRDIIERFKVKNEEGLRSLLRLLLNSTSYSVSKLYNTLKSAQIEIGKTTILNYILYIENSYFMFSVPVLSKKIKNQLQYPRKIYFTDTGFITALSLKFSDNIGRLYENLVFIELKRRNNLHQEIYYWRSEQKEEVDFVIREGLKTKQLIQVCYDIDDYAVKKRELKALLKACSELKCNKLLVITKYKEGEEKLKGKKIKYAPLWKWLLKLD
ncbi:ATP-binding protein [Candidatus Woesearchaeota archaeon]|nr:ATP-binding protein [Candidatus Woesearchaeota archaeon]